MSLTECNKFKKDLKNSKTHGFMHLPEEHKKEIFTFHKRDKHKTVWYKGGDWIEMESKNSPTNPELVSYRCPTFPYHSLHESVLTVKTPKIKAVEGYRICFCDNLLINMIKNFRLFHNEIELQHENTLSILEEIGTDNFILKEIGNKLEITGKHEILNPTLLSLKLPFYYSQNYSDAFPLIYCGQKDDLIHQIEFNLDFSSLIKIYDLQDVEIPFHSDLIEVENNMEMMPIPELEGLFSFLREEDAKLINSFSSDDVGEDKELFTKSIYYYEDENPKFLNNKVVLKFANDDKQPVQNIVWGAVNNTLSQKEKSLKVHLVTEEEELSPIKTTEKLSASSGVLVSNKSSYKTEFAYHSQQGRLGINKWSNSVNNKGDGKKFIPGVKCSSGSLTVKLNDKVSEDKFTVFAILKYIKRFRFTSYPKSFQERKDLRSTLVPDDED